MNPKGNLPAAAVSSAENEAAGLFIQRLYGDWNENAQADFEARLAGRAGFAQAYQKVEDSWRALDTHSEAPELVTWRAEAIELIRRANARRWFPSNSSGGLTHRWKMAAAVAGLALLAAAWQLSPFGYRPGEYRTGIGEQSTVELPDHSRITLDAASRIKVRFTDATRTVQLLEGQAQFSVAKDSSRPFKVIAGERTIRAIGTTFTVEYVDRKLHVAMLEGKVSVTSSSQAGQRPSIGDGRGAAEVYLTAGEELRVAHNGRAVVNPKADLEMATAWREGRVIFRTELLGEAASRMNRYSHLQIRIDDFSLASKHISGVFEAGDTRGFVDALQRYLSITADYSGDEIVRLAAK